MPFHLIQQNLLLGSIYKGLPGNYINQISYINLVTLTSFQYIAGCGVVLNSSVPFHTLGPPTSAVVAQSFSVKLSSYPPSPSP